MQRGVRYLFSGLWRGKGEEERGEEGRRVEKRSYLFRREGKEGAQAESGRKILLPWWTGERMGGTCLLKGQDRPLQ